MIRSTVGILAGSAGGFDADYQAVLDYATTQTYTLPSASQQALQNQLVVDLKDAGIWSKLDTFGVFASDAEDSAGSGTSNFALIDWIRLAQYTAYNSPTFNVNEGFQGNGTSSYIDLNYTSVTDWNNVTQNDACVFAYQFVDIYPLNGMIFGSLDTQYMQMNVRNAGSNIVGRLHSRSNSLDATTDGQGITLFNRNTSSSFDIYQRGSFVANSTETSSNSISPLYVLRYSTLYYETTPSFFGYSSSLTSTQITDLSNYLDTYIAAL